MTPIREQLIKITANMADEPAITMIQLEKYIINLICEAKIEQLESDRKMFHEVINEVKNK